MKTEDVSMGSLNVSILVTEEAIERLREDGWKVSDNTTFERNGVTITLISVGGGECTSDADCATGGCSGEVCAPREGASKILTPCVYRQWYDCLPLTSCGCVNGLCTWKPNQAFESCLREHGVDPSQVVRAGYFELRVEGINKSDGEINAALKDFLGAFGVSCNSPLTLVKTAVIRLSPTINPSEVNASGAIKAELEWMRGFGIVNMSGKEVEEISAVARWGFAGHNGKIGWYEGANGSYAWMPYYRSRNPSLIKCVSMEVPPYRLPNGTAYVGPTVAEPPSESPATASGSTNGEVCGPAVVIGLPLLLLLFRRR
ncbi:CGP-CTERM-anchored Cys-rich protein [Thermococcus thioreducens]|uniref:CGP-CTERM-anchored Cys-rich protein n=1 Tax=Thermococcus thioreducens TaxID=277988 RepID=UPI000B1A3D10|nr:CGP-CTERM-anchored Cys-rich protein [Thermococcus thioreducens]